MFVLFISFGDGTHKTSVHTNYESLAYDIEQGLSTPITEEMKKEIESLDYGGDDSIYHVFNQHNGNDEWFNISYFRNRDIAHDILNEEVPTIAIKNDNLTIDDRCEIFRTVLYGSSDVTGELLQSVVNEFGVSGIEIIDSNIYE